MSDVIEWLKQLKANALTVPNPQLADKCEQAIVYIAALEAQIEKLTPTGRD